MSEAVTRRCSVKKKFLKISQNSQQNACARAFFLIKLQFSGDFIKKRGFGTEHFFYGTP